MTMLVQSPWVVSQGEVLSSPGLFLNRAFLYGESIFTTFTMRNKKFFAVGDNLRRLEESFHFLYGNSLPPLLTEEFHSNLKFIQNYYSQDLVLRPTIYAPCTELAPRAKSENFRLLFFLSPLGHVLEEVGPLGLALESNPSLLPIKQATLISRLREVRRQKLSDLLFYGSNMDFTSASTANVFFVFPDKICTPPIGPGVFPGITRKYLLENSPHLADRPVQEANIKLSQLPQIEAIFLTNQVQLILFVTSLENSWQEAHNGRECAQNFKNICLSYYHEKF